MHPWGLAGLGRVGQATTLRVSLQGNEVLILESWARGFSIGPLDIADAFDVVKREHNDKWKTDLCDF